MFKPGDKVRNLETLEIGEVVEIMPSTWIRPVRVKYAEALHDSYTMDGCKSSLSKEKTIEKI